MVCCISRSKQREYCVRQERPRFQKSESRGMPAFQSATPSFPDLIKQEAATEQATWRAEAVESGAQQLTAIILERKDAGCFHFRWKKNVLGTLSVLSDLEKKASERQKETAKTKYHQRVQHSQLQKIKQLQHRRDELLNLLCTKADAETRKINGETGDTDTQDEDSVASALNYVTELKEKLQMYKMTGVCVVKTDPDSKVLSFTTSYKGTYLESYHLKLQRLASGTFKVIHHDLPAFIMYATLPDNLEVKDMPSAVRPLQEALSMFVLRREELERAQNKFGDSLQVRESSAALDHLCCHLDIGNSVQVEITLKYPDLKHYLPSSVKTVLLKQGETQREEIPQDIADSVQSTFCSNDLYTALSTTANTMLNYCHQDGQ